VISTELVPGTHYYFLSVSLFCSYDKFAGKTKTTVKDVTQQIATMA